jgi:hypothetical protein
VRDEHAGEASLGHDVVEERLDVVASGLVERGRRLVQEQDLGGIGQRAREGDALGLPAGEPLHGAIAVSLEVDSPQQALELGVVEAVSAARGSEADVVRDRAREEPRRL